MTKLFRSRGYSRANRIFMVADAIGVGFKNSRLVGICISSGISSWGKLFVLECLGIF